MNKNIYTGTVNDLLDHCITNTESLANTEYNEQLNEIQNELNEMIDLGIIEYNESTNEYKLLD